MRQGQSPGLCVLVTVQLCCVVLCSATSLAVRWDWWRQPHQFFHLISIQRSIVSTNSVTNRKKVYTLMQGCQTCSPRAGLGPRTDPWDNSVKYKNKYGQTGEMVFQDVTQTKSLKLLRYTFTITLILFICIVKLNEIVILEAFQSGQAKQVVPEIGVHVTTTFSHIVQIKSKRNVFNLTHIQRLVTQAHMRRTNILLTS